MDQNISYNYYDPNYYNNYNQANDQRFDSYYENNINYYPNIESKIATNIAQNYRQSTNVWTQDYDWPQNIYDSNYQLNNYYNRWEQHNGYQTLAEDLNLNSTSIETPFNEIQNYRYLDKRNHTFQRISGTTDSIIPTTVEDLEKEIKIEKDFNSINETQDKQINRNNERESSASISGSVGSSNTSKSKAEQTFADMETLSTLRELKRKKKKQMSFEEIIREKRESNRLAAIKCRQKKLSQLDSMEKKSKQLVEENQKLEQRLNEMRAQFLETKLALIHHRNGGCLLNPFHN